jgi:beta-lactamase regulating signal transducer with metallopeptidase domain
MMTSTFQSLGWALIHFCWQGAAIFAFYLMAEFGLRRAGSHTRYLLALATLSSMFLVFAATLGYEALHLVVASPHPVVTVPVTAFRYQVQLLENRPKPLHGTALLPWLDGAWMLGVIGLSVRSLGGWLWLQRLRRRATEVAPEAIQERFQKVCVKVGIAHFPKLRISRIVPGPMTIGIFRALVLVPASALLALSPEQLEAIFAHELAHVRRADYFWNLVQTLAETLFFFHPAVWRLGKKLRDQRELCCDDIAVEVCSDPLVYATALFRLESQRARSLNLGMALDGHQTQTTFRSRILRILGQATPQPARAQLRPLSLMAVCLSVFFLLSPLPRVLGNAAAQSPPAKQILAVPAEIVRSAKNLSIRSRYGTPAPGKPAGVDDAPEVQHAPTSSQAPAPVTASASEYIEYEKQMRAVGYDVNEGRYNVMQRAGITPAFAKEMSNLDLGRPATGTVLELKEQNVSAQDRTNMRAAGVRPRGVNDLISYRTFNIPPEFIAGMSAAGFDSIPPGKLRALRALGVDPEYRKAIRQQFPNASVQELIESQIRLNGDPTGALSETSNLPPPAFLNPTSPQPPPHIPGSSIPGQPRRSEASGRPRQSELSGRPRQSEISGRPRRSESPPPLTQ